MTQKSRTDNSFVQRKKHIVFNLLTNARVMVLESVNRNQFICQEFPILVPVSDLLYDVLQLLFQLTSAIR